MVSMISAEEETVLLSAALDYGVVIAGPTRLNRESFLRELFGPDCIVVSCRTNRVASAVLYSLAVRLSENTDIDALDTLRTELPQTDSNLCILDFDALPFDEQQRLTERLQTVFDSCSSRSALIGYTTTNPTAVVSANPAFSDHVLTAQLKN